MRSKIAFALFALLAVGTVAVRSASNAPAPAVPAPAVSPPVAIVEERAQLAAQCELHHQGALVRVYPDPKYPDSFQMTTLQCQHGFLVESWDAATLQRSH